jgi:hypothetical protein
MSELVILDHHEALANPPGLSIEPDPDGRGWCVRARGLGSALATSPCERLGSLLRVEVAEVGDLDREELPGISGDYLVRDDEVRFTPHFPFEAGVSFRAILDLRVLRQPGTGEVLTREFSFPAKTSNEVSEVTQIYPSSGVLPENLLRFYVRFSSPMQRGCVEDNVEMLGPGGSSAPDVLYRAPVELWDRSITCLTILLDPGRLKRGVGPNRTLGPPLKAGQRYTLKIGPGMIDVHGRRLRDGFSKSFSIAKAVREPIAIEAWSIRPPAIGSREPLELTFPWPLDWAQLWHGIAVTSETDGPVGGQIDIDMGEKRWRLAPDIPWRAGAHWIRISPTLEDVCGNTTSGPFDGPFRSADDVARETVIRSITFVV